MQDASQIVTESSEIWKPVAGFPRYEVSNHGRVRTFFILGSRRIAEIPSIMKLQRSGYKGLYDTVYLTENKNLHTKLVHNLVLEAFVGERPDGYEGCHGPLGVRVNSVSNLSWGTKKKNSYDDKIRDGTLLVGEDVGTAKLTNVAVQEIRERLRSGESLAVIANVFNVAVSVISKINWGNSWRGLPILFELKTFPIYQYKARYRRRGNVVKIVPATQPAK